MTIRSGKKLANPPFVEVSSEKLVYDKVVSHNVVNDDDVNDIVVHDNDATDTVINEKHGKSKSKSLIF